MSDDLFEALAALRNDPSLAYVFHRNTTGVGSSARSSTPPKSESPQGHPPPPYDTSSPISGRLMATASTSGRVPDPVEGTIDGSPAMEFIRRRNAERDSLGTPHWLARHRQELTEGEQRRLENRLRAEQLFASANLQFEEFQQGQLRLSSTASHHFDEPQHHPTPSSASGSVSRSAALLQTSRVDYDGSRTEAARLAARIHEEVHGPAAAALSGGGGADVRNGSMKHTEPLTVPASPPRPSPVAETLARGLDLPAVPPSQPPLDEAANYEAKVAALALPTTIPAHTLPSSASPPPVLFYSRHGPGLDDIDSSASARRHDRAAYADERAHMGSLDLLRKAVADRDETIQRLERRLREQDDLYERTMHDTKREHQEAMRHADQRASLLESQIQELAKSLTTSNAEAVRDAQRALAEAQANFTLHSESLREEMSTLLKGYQIGLDSRLRDVMEAADLTNRSCRETYVMEKAEVITAEKERLLERLAREQQLMLREAEIQLGDELEKQMLSKLRSDVRHYVNESAEALLIPKLRALLGDDVEDYFGTSVQHLVQAKVAEATRLMRDEVQSSLSAGREELQTLSSLLAAETMANSAQLVESTEVAKHRQLFEELKAAAEQRAEEHRLEADENSKRTKELSEKLSRLETELEAERSVSRKLAEELLTLRTVRSALA